MNLLLFSLYALAIITLFFPYAELASVEIVNEYQMKEVYLESVYYGDENFSILIALGFTALIGAISFLERTLANSIRMISFSVITIGLLVVTSISLKMGPHGPIPQVNFSYYLMNGLIVSIMAVAHIKTWVYGKN